MAAIGRYDHELEMFVEAPHEIDLHRAEFMRWLVEHGRAGAEHGTAGPPSGELAAPASHGEQPTMPEDLH